MVDLDEYAARAVAQPVASPPEMAQLQRRGQQRRRRRTVGRVGAGCGAVLLVAGVGIAVVRSGTEPSTVDRGGHPGNAPARGWESRSITRPVLETCVATRAAEGHATGTGHSDPEQAGEVFMVPDQGVAGPLAVLLRFPGVQSLDVRANASVAGRPARVDMGEGGQGGITWLLADGSAVLYGRDISSLLLNALAQAVTTKSSLPNGFVSIGMTTAATWAKSTCSAETTTTVEVFHGSQASRYARVLSEPPGIRWDDGDATFLVTTMPPSADSPRPPIRQATIAEWNALLDTR